MTIILNRCPATLKAGFNTYSPAALRKLFDGKKVSHFLDFESPKKNETTQALFLESRQRLSISGVQEKIGLLLDKDQLRLVQPNEIARFILKPIPDDLLFASQVPANEHLTMQLASQIFGIQTAHNAMIFFQDDVPAYLTKRFDFKTDGKKYAVEDFATLANKSRANAGIDFKYEGSCEKLFLLLRQYVGAYLIEAQKLFRLILFNYVFSNGDAHLKNFSLIESDGGDYVLSPAYDLICSRLHVNDSDIALKDGLFEDDFETESFKANGFYAYDDFKALGKKVGLPEKVVEKEINIFQNSSQKVKDLIVLSFLSPEFQTKYSMLFEDKLQRLNYSFQKNNS